MILGPLNQLVETFEGPKRPILGPNKPIYSPFATENGKSWGKSPQIDDTRSVESMF